MLADQTGRLRHVRVLGVVADCKLSGGERAERGKRWRTGGDPRKELKLKNRLVVKNIIVLYRLFIGSFSLAKSF